MGGPTTRAMKGALRGNEAQVREKAVRILREAADQHPLVAKRVAVHGVRLFAPSFPSCAGWLAPLLAEMAADRVSAAEPQPPGGPKPGLSLFVGAVVDLRAGFRRGEMFAEFAEFVADGLFQLALAEPVGRYGARERARWRAAFVLARNEDLAPLDALAVHASRATAVRKELALNLHHFAWVFDVIARERPEVAATFLSNCRRGRSSLRLQTEPSRAPTLDNRKR